MGSELDHPSDLNGSPDLSTVAQAVKMRQLHKNDSRIDFIVSIRGLITIRFQPYFAPLLKIKSLNTEGWYKWL